MKGALSQAWQSWKAAKGVALMAIVAFAVGIGSATAIFTIINGVLLRPLPYPQGDRIAMLFGANTNEPGRYSTSTFVDLIEYERRTSAFDVFGWFTQGSINLSTAGAPPQYLWRTSVTPSLAHNIGVNPRLGRWFTDDSGVVISDALWKRLGSKPNIVGTAVTLDGRLLTITGVMPEGFRLPVPGSIGISNASDVWIYLDPRGNPELATQGIYTAYARRKPGVSVAQALADVKRAAAEIAALNPATRRAYTADLVSLRENMLTDLRSTLVLLFGFQGEQIVAQPLIIALIAVPILIQVYLNAGIAYWLSRRLGVAWCVAAPAALIGASNFFELAVAAAISLFGFKSGAALATVVGVLVEVPVMLSVVAIVKRSRSWYERTLA